MSPMSIAETPIAAIRASHRATGDGVHLVARHYRKGVRLDTHMHREAQLVYAARGTMQVTTPKGRWLVPPDRAVWVPARLEHSIDVLADIEMRTLYFDVSWLKREPRGANLDAEFVVLVSRLLHETILALFDGRKDAERTRLLVKLAMLELHQAEDSSTFIPLPQELRCRRAADMALGSTGVRLQSPRPRGASWNGKQDSSGLIELCEALLSGRGEASGTAMAREVLDHYRHLDEAGRLEFFETLARHFGPDRERLGE